MDGWVVVVGGWVVVVVALVVVVAGALVVVVGGCVVVAGGCVVVVVDGRGPVVVGGVDPGPVGVPTTWISSPTCTNDAK